MIPLAIIVPVSLDRRALVALIALLVVVALGCVLHIGRGGGSQLLGPLDVLANVFKGSTREDSANIIVWSIRIPRMLAALLAGAILGSVGAAFQSFFRNPLAEPFVIGVSSGAGLGGTVAAVMGLSQWFFSLGTVLFAFSGGLFSLALVLPLARRGGGVQVHTLLLAGVVVSAMLSALMTTLLLLGGFDTNRVLLWLLGSLSNVAGERLWAMFAVLVVGMVVLQTQTRALNAFSVSDFTSERLGVDPQKLRRTVLLSGTAMVAVAVGAVGVIGFLGLMAPHIARRVVGIDLRYSLVASALTGSLLLLLADLVAQNLHGNIELPVGAVTALVGAPALLWLLKKQG